jgi:hypothetical protein
VISLSRCARHANPVWIDIETDDDSLRSNVWSNVSSDYTCAAGYIQDTFTQLRIRTLN